MKNTLIEIKALSIFFCNYKQEDIQELCQDVDFAIFWNEKRPNLSDDNEFAFWAGFTRYLGPKQQQEIYKMAMERYEQQAIRAMNAAFDVMGM